MLPTHVQYFTRPSLATLLRRSGFVPLAVSTAPKAFSAAYYLGASAATVTRSPARSSALPRRTGLAERIWAPDFRDRMLMIARKEPQT